MHKNSSDYCNRAFGRSFEQICIAFDILISHKVDEDGGGATWFSSRHDPLKGPSGTILRLCYVRQTQILERFLLISIKKYPALGAEDLSALCAETEKDSSLVRAASHTDFGTMTLLFQQPSQPGLEIQTPDSSWSPVDVFPTGTEHDDLPPIVVNIGDLLSFWTNGLLKSTVHRVAIPKEREQDRYSIAYFCHPVATTELVPIPSSLVNKAGDKLGADRRQTAKQAMTATEHLKNRLAAVYGWEKDNDNVSSEVN